MKNIFQSVFEIKNILPQGKTFTLIGGAFDLIHVGHIHLLKYANTLEDLLVELINQIQPANAESAISFRE